jgi:hypothetical protein
MALVSYFLVSVTGLSAHTTAQSSHDCDKLGPRTWKGASFDERRDEEDAYWASRARAPIATIKLWERVSDSLDPIAAIEIENIQKQQIVFIEHVARCIVLASSHFRKPVLAGRRLGRRLGTSIAEASVPQSECISLVFVYCLTLRGPPRRTVKGLLQERNSPGTEKRFASSSMTREKSGIDETFPQSPNLVDCNATSSHPFYVPLHMTPSTTALLLGVQCRAVRPCHSVPWEAPQ